MSLRKSQERPINSQSKEQNILRPFTLGTQTDKLHIRKVKTAIKRRNMLREMDRKIYNLIEECHNSNKIEWKSIYAENEEFRNTQKKKITNDNQQAEVVYDDLVEMIRLAGGTPGNEYKHLIDMANGDQNLESDIPYRYRPSSRRKKDKRDPEMQKNLI